MWTCGKGREGQTLKTGRMMMRNLVPVGTMVVANDGFSTRLGQVADYETTRWGTFHVVSIEGACENVGHIGGEDMLGIGWKVATSAEIERAMRWRAWELENANTEE
jgi:hypothetical protein